MSQKPVNFAILGAGIIARALAEAVTKMPKEDNIVPYAVGSRDISRAEALRAEFNFQKAYGSYEEMLNDPNVHLVYIATPHSHHYEHAKLCLEKNKHVLCEKAFTANAKQAREIIKLAEEKKLLLTEAIWPRYMPMAKTIVEVVNSGIIGEVSTLTANLGYTIDHVNRLVDPNLAGGALLDVGIYPLTFAAIVFGSFSQENIAKVTSTCTKHPKTGVDTINSITIEYKNGRVAMVYSTMLATTNRQGVIDGRKGYIEIENVNNYQALRVYDLERKCIKEIKCPKQINGYEYQVQSCLKAIREGKIECPEMPHEETIRMMEFMDSLRKEWGIKYPFE